MSAQRQEGSAQKSPRAMSAYVLCEKAAGSRAQTMVRGDGLRLLKALEQGQSSFDEVKAYHALLNTPISRFLCGYHGVKVIHGQGCMELDSAFAGMNGPCATLSIKIGLADSEQSTEGFSVTEIQAGGLSLTTKQLDRRGVERKELSEWILPAFFANDPGFGAMPEGPAGTCKPSSRGCSVDLTAARCVLAQLKALLAVAELGFKGTLQGPRLFVTREMRIGGKWSMNLVGLAGYRPSEGVDVNFCSGLAKLTKTWEAWCQDQLPSLLRSRRPQCMESQAKKPSVPEAVKESLKAISSADGCDGSTLEPSIDEVGSSRSHEASQAMKDPTMDDPVNPHRITLEALKLHSKMLEAWCSHLTQHASSEKAKNTEEDQYYEALSKTSYVADVWNRWNRGIARGA